MEKGFNLKVFDFKEELIKIINESDLPVCSKATAVSEIAIQLNNLHNQTIQAEKAEFEKSLKETE